MQPEKQGGRKAVRTRWLWALQQGLYTANQRIQKLKIMIGKINHNSKTYVFHEKTAGKLRGKRTYFIQWDKD